MRQQAVKLEEAVSVFHLAQHGMAGGQPARRALQGERATPRVAAIA
jgi:hypothetical protein